MNRKQEDYEGKEKRLHIVGIEWDGQRPPTKWYRRLDELTGGIRGKSNDKEVSPIERRFDETKGGLILQEGLILCQSYYLARELALYARDTIGRELIWKGGKPPTVYIGEALVSNVFSANREDEALLSRMEKTLGKRGKKPGKEWYSITCIECMESYSSKVPKDHVVNCPKCGSLKIHWRTGKTRNFRDTGEDIVKFWKRVRFHGTHWEPAQIAILDQETETFPEPPELEDLLIGAREHETITLIENSDQVLHVAQKLAETNRHEAIDFLDAVFVGKTHLPTKIRSKSRIAAATEYFLKGGDPQFGIMGEIPNQADVLDAAPLLGETRTANYIINYLMNGGYKGE
jgi:hypothetical protein